MIKYTKLNNRDMKQLIPYTAKLLCEAGVNKSNYNLSLCLKILGSHSNRINLLSCIMRNESAIFEALKW